MLVGARGHGRGVKAAAELAADGLDARFVQLDVTDQATIDAAAAFVDAEYGRLDILVDNAGISRERPHKPSELPVATRREIYETNVFGVVAVINAMLPLLRRSAAGRITNVSSELGTAALMTDLEGRWERHALLLGYNSSKAALNAVTLVYAAELRDTPIKVNAVSPGFCATDLNGHIGVLSADEGGAKVAQVATLPGDWPTGMFLSEGGGFVLW